MTQKIQILPENLCNQIAAGEVIERPASVVKELLENSLDAGAGDIRVDVEKGGKRRILVVDDGDGMGRDDVFLCLERHATSKIRSDTDLFGLKTLGFRGEALPSIAAVSRLTVRSCSAAAPEGWEIYVEGGTVKRAGAAGLPRGTSMEVRDLFFNTPARRKFLRRDETELGHIGEVVTKLALAHPQVQFRLVHNGRSLLDVYRQNTLAERVGSLLGRPLVRELLPVEAQAPGGLKLRGLISQPAANRSSTSAVYTFINGRYVRDRVVQHALLEGYRHLLPNGRYPVVALFLEIDPALVDVNVHPTKHEVRFRDQRTVHDFIAATVRETLRPSGWLAASGEVGGDGGPEPEPEAPRQQAVGTPVGAAPQETVKKEDPRHRVREALFTYGRSHANPAAPVVVGRPQVQEDGAPFVFPTADSEEETGFFASLEIIGQYRNSYILCQDGNDLVLVDQHAAHERIGFERLKAQYHRGRVERQALLFPVTLEFDFRGAALLQEHLGDLERLGFDLEPFGGNTFALKAVPRLLGDAESERLIREVAEGLEKIGRRGPVEEALDDLFILMACHNVVRANQRLTLPEMAALLRELDRVDFSAHCPHGRPVMTRLPLGEVERMFKRS